MRSKSIHKIIYITRNFPPLLGGMERLNYHMYDELRKTYAVFLIGPKGAEAFCEQSSPIATCPPKPVWLFLLTSFWQTLGLIFKHRPAMIFAGSGVAAFPAVIAGKIGNVPVLTYLHGLDIIAPNPIYQHIFLPVIRRSKGWIVNSRNTGKLAIAAGLPANKIEVLNPGTDLPDLSGFDGGRLFRERIHAGNRPILISVGRLTERKGLLEFISYALPEIIAQIPDILLVVIGGDPIQSVAGSSGASSNILRLKIKELKLESNVILLGNVDDKTLSEAFMASQLHVFPVLDLPGDVEGFGMVAVEAAAHGLPTVAFSVGGTPDSINTGVSGWLVPASDYVKMVNIITNYLMFHQYRTITPSSCRKYAEGFAWSVFAKRLNSICMNFLVSRPTQINNT